MKHIFQRRSWYGVFAFLFLSIPYIWVDPLFGGDTAEYIRMFARRPPLYSLFLRVLQTMLGERGIFMRLYSYKRYLRHGLCGIY